MARKEPGCTICVTVHAKEMHVTSEDEFGHQYGSNKKTKLVKGKEQLKILSKYDLGCGIMKQSTLHSKSVKP